MKINILKDFLIKISFFIKNHEMAIDAVQKKINSMGLKNVETVLINGYNCPLPDGIADRVCALDMIQTTAAMQRFSDGINADPGDMPGVGGPVDVAVITADNGFVWVNKKKLRSGGNEVDMG